MTIDTTKILPMFVLSVCFFASFYALNGIDFSKVMRKNHTVQIQVLIILLALAIGYGAAQFFLNFSLK